MVRSRTGSHIAAQALSHQAPLFPVGARLSSAVDSANFFPLCEGNNKRRNFLRKKWLHVPSAMSHPMHKLEVSELFMVLQKTD